MPTHNQTTTIRYLNRTNQRPVYLASQAGADAQFDIDVGFDEREVIVHDARKLQPAPTLDHHGFTLVNHKSLVKDFYDAPEHDSYAQELIKLICATTGAETAQVFDQTLRSDSSTVRGRRNTREPAGFIHNDYTDASAHKRMREMLTPEEAEKRSNSRFAIINVWRPIREPVWTSPMTCCDSSTLSPEDLIAVERRAKERVGELEFAHWNSAHRWYYFPQMKRDEVLLIKTFDSAKDGRATRCIHTAFNNALAPSDAPPRESIESRLLVFFAE